MTSDRVLLERVATVTEHTAKTADAVRADVERMRAEVQGLARDLPIAHERIAALGVRLDAAAEDRKAIAKTSHAERAALAARVSKLERSKWWAVGAGAGIGAATTLVLGVAKWAVSAFH